MKGKFAIAPKIQEKLVWLIMKCDEMIKLKASVATCHADYTLQYLLHCSAVQKQKFLTNFQKLHSATLSYTCTHRANQSANRVLLFWPRVFCLPRPQAHSHYHRFIHAAHTHTHTRARAHTHTNTHTLACACKIKTRQHRQTDRSRCSWLRVRTWCQAFCFNFQLFTLGWIKF